MGCPWGPIEALQGFGILRLPRKQTCTVTGEVSLLFQERLNDFSDPSQILVSVQSSVHFFRPLCPQLRSPVVSCDLPCREKGCGQRRLPPSVSGFLASGMPWSPGAEKHLPRGFSTARIHSFNTICTEIPRLPVCVIITHALCVYTLHTAVAAPHTHCRRDPAEEACEPSKPGLWGPPVRG